MPLGIVSDADFEQELQKSEPIQTANIIPMPTPGRKEGDNNVPDSLRKIIGETSEIDGRKEALALASHFGISPSSVSAYANGSTSTDSMNKRPNLPHINKAKEVIARSARNKLRDALKHITSDKLENTKAVDLASIARSMSAVVKEMEPEQEIEQKKDGPAFVIYSPQFKQENHYEIVAGRDSD
jgi:predicted transcriptional regulator